MPTDGLSVMRAWYETWNRGDLDAFAELYAPHAEMTPPASWVETGTLRGREEIRRFFEGLKEAWEGEDSAILHELIPAGELVVSRMDWQVRGRVSGIDTRLALTNVNAFEDGRIVSQQHSDCFAHLFSLDYTSFRIDQDPCAVLSALRTTNASSALCMARNSAVSIRSAGPSNNLCLIAFSASAMQCGIFRKSVSKATAL